MLIARTSNEFTKINKQENSRCNARGYMRKGKGRPDITEVMYYPGYPSGSNSSFTSECVGIGHYFRNFPTARYIFTAGFELFGCDHGHLATL